MGSLYSAGGIFMTPITLLGLLMIGLGAVTLIRFFSGVEDKDKLRRFNALVLQLGIFIFFLGVLSQAMGLMQAFQVISQVGGVSPTLLADGLYVSMIAPVYALLFLLLAIALWSVGKYKLS
ncbi:MAG: MotA/TolQ/ExbB proton channel family protein [Bacteroidetes bacterium]|nr:MotA/TolQ/ExbB proton channel family protein [Bacteroidota bacterium]MDA1333419.1 MotA/TolQ/ExbB proton channel family protein [Bacteroidota bacterium]